MATKKKQPAKKKKRTHAQIGAQSRRKGAAYELTAAAMLRSAFHRARRGIGQSRSGGDVPDVEGCEPFWVQCKHGAVADIRAAMRQAITELSGYNARDERSRYSVPLVMARRNGGEDTITLRASDFIRLLEQIKQSQQVLPTEQPALPERSTAELSKHQTYDPENE